MIIKIKKICNLIFGTLFIRIYQLTGRVQGCNKVRVIGIPLFNIEKKSVLIIGDSVTLNSFNDDYHVNMNCPVKIFIENTSSFVNIGENTRIHGSCIHASKKIVIGRRCLIAANCNIIDSNGHKALFNNPEIRYQSSDDPREIIIEDDVWIGMNSIILPGVKIGRGAIIAANSVVNSDIPPGVLARGNPAKVIATCHT
jgi:acetyltransferase-like isoleucine patch superfamily enzyme